MAASLRELTREEMLHDLLLSRERLVTAGRICVILSNCQIPAGESQMREAVIVSTARTPIGRAYRGAFNDTQAQALAGHAIAEAVRRAKVDPAEIEDGVLGAALEQG